MSACNASTKGAWELLKSSEDALLNDFKTDAEWKKKVHLASQNKVMMPLELDNSKIQLSRSLREILNLIIWEISPNNNYAPPLDAIPVMNSRS